ncbi:MAG: hypothetical protein HG439_000615 [candidate division SR1 bacterium]|nr:hypothetical protein [candidate division SR1 bacterium]
MKVSIGFSGPAGSGVNTAGLFLAEILSEKGYTVLGDKEYASIIKGDNNCFFLYISDENQVFIRKEIDFFLAYDQYSISKNEPIYDLRHTFMIKDENCKYRNTFTLGAALKLLNLSIDEGKAILKRQFSLKSFSQEIMDQNYADLEAGYEYIKRQENTDFPQIDCSKVIGEKKIFMYGNECIAKGAMDSDLEFYAAYPMTPASSIIDEVVKNKKVTFLQAEDEIAVGMAMLGSKFAGKRSMCGTSGGGFALMTEAIAFSNQAEIGGVYVLSQRDGPSTGTPTFTGQGDINYALNASFGDTKPIVLYPSTFEEAYNFAGKALNYSDIYQHPVILLSDKQLSESYLTIEKKNLISEPVLRGKIADESPEDTFKRFEITEDGISPYSYPGRQGTTFIASSYEHDEYGFTNEEPTIKGEMMEKRARKIQTFIQNEFNENFYGYEIINPEAKNFFITMGVNRYALEQWIKNNSEYGLIIVKSLYPFDPRLKAFLEKNREGIQNLIFVEMNHSGMLEDLVRKECELYGDWNSKISHQRKVTLYPLFEEEIQAVQD